MSDIQYNTIGEQFSAIAKRYDSMNQILSFGVHHYWRHVQVQYMCKKLELRHCTQPLILDLATGTYDVACSLKKHMPGVQIIGIDASLGMLCVGNNKIAAYKDSIYPVQADARYLPLQSESVNGITISFGLRNMYPRMVCFQEWYRVLKPGGILAIVEFNNPDEVMLVFRWAYKLYLRSCFPVLAKMLGVDGVMYSYLAKSIQAFPFSQGICSEAKLAGFSVAHVKKLTFGVVSLYCFTKRE